MPKKKQGNLFEQTPKRGPKQKRPHGHFGGIYFKNYNPKIQRPMDSKKALHVVLKSSQAVRGRSFKSTAFEGPVWDIIQDHAKRNGIKLYEYANSGNHLHILLRAKTRDSYKTFIRSITGLIARLVGKSEKGKPLKKKFWDGRPFTRVVSFSTKEYKTTKDYLLRNNLEALGWMTYVPRHKRLPPDIKNWLESSTSISLE